jgi:hypothetical protein
MARRLAAILAADLVSQVLPLHPNHGFWKAAVSERSRRLFWKP